MQRFIRAVKSHRLGLGGRYDGSTVSRHVANPTDTGTIPRIGQHFISIFGAMRNPNKGKKF